MSDYGVYTWLTSEYPIKSRGKGEHKIIGKGASSTLASTFVNVVRGFYSMFNIYVKFQGRHALPKSEVVNKRIIVTSEQVKSLIELTKNPRDKAIIAILFQSGMDASTLCSLRYGQIEAGLANDDYPLKIELRRIKTKVDYYTFLGKDAIEMLKTYLEFTKSHGAKFKPDSPIFLSENNVPLKPHNVQSLMHNLAIQSGLVSSDLKYNILGSHALRESFGSILFNNGVNETIIDFLLGHSIGKMSEAYKSVNAESVRKIYFENEKYLKITQEN